MAVIITAYDEDTQKRASITITAPLRQATTAQMNDWLANACREAEYALRTLHREKYNTFYSHHLTEMLEE